MRDGPGIGDIRYRRDDAFGAGEANLSGLRLDVELPDPDAAEEDIGDEPLRLGEVGEVARHRGRHHHGPGRICRRGRAPLDAAGLPVALRRRRGNGTDARRGKQREQRNADRAAHPHQFAASMIVSVPL